jgi:hypothetical protein
MSTTVECDRACLADGQEISVAEATSGANGYFCLGCGYELMARKGEVNTPHFAHVPTGTDAERSCDYSSETYRHELAKKLLQRLMQVRVPAVYAARPVGYRGRLPQLAEARDVMATRVLDERNVYVDEHGEVCFAKRYRNEPFDEQQGRRLLLGRPDIVFLDKQGAPLLLIEIYATHKVSEEKLTRLRLLGVDAIEIFIPRHCDPAAIEHLFSTTTHTHWLYNGQQANAGPLAPDSHLLASGSAAAADLEDRLSGRTETLKCRRSRVSHAWAELTSKASREKLLLLRQRARRLLQEVELIEQDLKRNEASVTSDLEKQFDNELLTSKKLLQRRSESLQHRRQLLAERKASWPSELAQLRTSYATLLQSLRSKSNERKAQLRTSLEMEWKQLETNETGAGPSLTDLVSKQQQLLEQQQNLTEKQLTLSHRREALELLPKQIAADLSAQQQTSENTSSLRQSWKNKRQCYADLKTKLIELGLISSEEFPNL